MTTQYQQLEFDCSVCNNPLMAFPNSDASGYTIKPCDSCNELERSMGYSDGYREGFSHGSDEDE